MNLRKSASLRLTLLVALAISTISLLGLALYYTQLERALYQRTTERLHTELDNYAALYEQRRIIAVRQAMEFRASLNPNFDTIYLLQDKQHQFLGGNITQWPADVAPSETRFDTGPITQSEITLPDGRLQTYQIAARSLPGGFPIIIGISLEQSQKTLTEMLKTILILGGIMVVVGIGAGALVTHYMFRRILKIVGFLDNVDQDNIDKRLPTDAREDEFALLGLHINQMLDRIDRLNAAHQKLGDVIAHEMRTPLGRIQNLIAELDAAEDQKGRISDEIHNTIRLFDSLLNIATVDAQTGSRTGLQPINLSQICAQLYELYQPVSEDNGRLLTADITHSLWVLGDANLIAQLISNLVENGNKFTQRNNKITLELRTNGATHDLTIHDTGPGLPAGLEVSIFDQFVRGQNTDAQGHGLGLALVKAIALRHGAKVTLPKVKKGFAIRISWPRFSPNLQID